MNIAAIKEKLKEAVDVVSRVASEHPNLPILRNISISAREGKIKLVATNLEIGITYFLPGKVIEEGSITVPAALLSQVVGNIQQDRLSLVAKNSSLEITTDNYHATLQGLPAEDFPIVPEIKNKAACFVCDAETIRAALSQTLSASQFSELRPVLNSVFFRFLLDKIVLVATDSFRLSEVGVPETQFETTASKEIQKLIPLKTASEVVRIIKDGEKIKICFDENQVLFQTERFELLSRLIEGTFPDYQAIVPKSFSVEATLNKEEFASAVKLSGVMSGSVNEVVVRVSEGKKAIEIFSGESSLGENTSVLAAKIDTKKTKTIEAGFNWRYLLDGLRTIQSEEVFFGLNEENKPAMLRSPQKTQNFYILMPILKR